MLTVYEEGVTARAFRLAQGHNSYRPAPRDLTSSSEYDVRRRRPQAQTQRRRDGKPGQEGEGVNLLAIAFYTETEHKVDPVTKDQT